MLAKTKASRRSAVTDIAGTSHRRLFKVVSLKAYGTKSWTLLDSGPVPNIVFTDLMNSLSLSLMKSKKGTTVAIGLNCPTYGSHKEIPISFGNVVVPMDFLLIHGSPFEIIIGIPMIESLMAQIDVGKQVSRLCMNKGAVQLLLEPAFGKKRKKASGTDNEDFTSDSDAVLSTSSKRENILAMK